MPGPLDLADLAETFLQLCVDALNTLPAQGLQGAQDRRYVSPGLPVWDCPDMLVVHVQPVVEADTTPGGLDAGRRSARFARINHVGLIATSLRCIPTGSENNVGTWVPPDPVELGAAARQLNADAWALWNHLFNAVHAEGLLTLCDEVFWDAITPVIPSGGAAGWLVTARASLGGYTELFGS